MDSFYEDEVIYDAYKDQLMLVSIIGVVVRCGLNGERYHWLGEL